MEKLELISFPTCPFVQRSVILLRHKGIPFTRTEVDLMDAPAWFEKVSPLGQVPVLRIHDKGPGNPAGSREARVLFESAVINEYLDEINPPGLQPPDPFERARARAWIALSGELYGTQYQLFSTDDAQTIAELQKDLFDNLARVEEAVGQPPYFSGAQLSLVDTTYAPLFMRLALSPVLWAREAWRALPKTRAWGEALLTLPAVQGSVSPDFAERFRSQSQGSPLL